MNRYNIILAVVLLFTSAMNIGAMVKLYHTEQRINGMFCIEARDY